MIAANTIINSDVLAALKTLPDQSVHTCVTSPPYWGLRDYGHEGQIGLEETPEAFVSKLVAVFDEVKRVLRNDGTLWLNLGDSYAANRAYQVQQSRHGEYDTNCERYGGKGSTVPNGLKPKDLVGIPWRVAFALQSAGWYLRQDIIWYKRSPMPESVTDRCTKAHEYIFLLSKSQKYFFDHEAIQEPIADASVQRLAQDIENQKGSDRVPGKTNGRMKAVGTKSTFGNRNGELGNLHSGKQWAPQVKHKNLEPDGQQPHSLHLRRANGESDELYAVRNKRSVWDVTTKPYKDAHFATFPEDLIVPCIKAGCPEGGLVLDPFMGAGTTAVVARKLNRNFIGCELNPKYVQLANNRLQKELGLFNHTIDHRPSTIDHP